MLLSVVVFLYGILPLLMDLKWAAGMPEGCWLNGPVTIVIRPKINTSASLPKNPLLLHEMPKTLTSLRDK